MSMISGNSLKGLPLIYISFKAVNFVIESGRFINLLSVKSRRWRFFKFPISSGRSDISFLPK